MIRPATQRDLAECAVLVGRIPFFAAYFSAAQAHRLLAERPALSTLLVDQEEQGERIRGLSLFLTRDQLSRGGYLKLFAVAPESQGEGVAGRLLGATEDEVFEHSDTLFLMVNTDNGRARQFYQRHGYRALGVIPSYARAGQDELVMYKRREAP